MNTQNSVINILFIGDIVGRAGRKAVKKALSVLKNEYEIDLTIANIENSANGFGITANVYKELKSIGVDFFTSGNHIWDKKEILDHIADFDRLIRPANYPEGVPGEGVIKIEINNTKLILVNLMGRVFMPLSDCPFKKFDEIVLKYEDCLPIVDFHAEATSEKQAFSYFADKRAAAVLGTHTHVQTNDERILSGGTFYITDVGMCGALNSCIGVEWEHSVKRFLTSMPVKFDVEKKGELLFSAVFFSIDKDLKKVVSFKKIYNIYGE